MNGANYKKTPITGKKETKIDLLMLPVITGPEI